MTRILIVEDEEAIARFLELELRHEGYAVQKAGDGRTGLELAESGNFDLVLLDILLPELSGLEVIRRLRRSSQIPVIMLTARDTVMDKVSGLDMGADDYITKPFAIEELLARIRSTLRKHGRAVSHDLLTCGGLTMDPARHTVTYDGTAIDLTSREFDVLKLLMENPGKVYSTRNLYEEVWKEACYGSEGAVAVHIRHLREKIEINPSEPRYLKVVWGQGYKLEGGN